MAKKRQKSPRRAKPSRAERRARKEKKGGGPGKPPARLEKEEAQTGRRTREVGQEAMPEESTLPAKAKKERRGR